MAVKGSLNKAITFPSPFGVMEFELASDVRNQFKPCYVVSVPFRGNGI